MKMKRKGQPTGSAPEPSGEAACRRGQGALEYLMTYGWAILIIVIIGGALYALGVFNPATWTSAKRATGFASLQVKDWKLASGGAATLVMGNKYGASIDVTGISLNRTGGATLYNCSLVATTTLAENQEMTTTTDVGNCATGLTSGKSYTADVQIYFTSGSVAHIDSGVITGKVE